MRQSAKVALGGVFGALAMVCLLGTVFPYATLALPLIAGLILLPVAQEAGLRWGWLTFGAVAALNLLITPSMEAKVLFIAFFGYYPVLRLSLEKLPRPLAAVLKFLLFNAAVVAAYWLMIRVFGMEGDFEIFGVNLPLVMLALGNVLFLMYDIIIGLLLEIYRRFLHPRLSRMLNQ